MGRVRAGEAGGILSAAEVLANHRGALDYDLMTRTNYTVRDVPGALRWDALAHFVAHLPPDSAVCSEVDKELWAWANPVALRSSIADVYDLIAAFRWDFERANSKPNRHIPKPKPYPRPGKDDAAVIGHDPIPVKDFESWWSDNG